MKENPTRSLPGIPVLLAVLAVATMAAWMFFTGMANDDGVLPGKVLTGVALGVVGAKSALNS